MKLPNGYKKLEGGRPFPTSFPVAELSIAGVLVDVPWASIGRDEDGQLEVSRSSPTRFYSLVLRASSILYVPPLPPLPPSNY